MVKKRDSNVVYGTIKSRFYNITLLVSMGIPSTPAPKYIGGMSSIDWSPALIKRGVDSKEHVT